MNSPLISIIIPCYNQAQYLDECLQSVLEQTYSNWECIIVNDGSLDNTEEVAHKWVKKDHKFKYLYKENGGLSSARNAGIEIANGEWILPLDSDDKIGNHYLELAKDKFKDFDLVYCKAKRFGIEDQIWDLPKFSLNSFLLKNCIFCSVFFKKKDWKTVNGYDEEMTYGLEDWEFLINLISHNKNKVYQINYLGFYYRIKKNSMITNLAQSEEKSKKMEEYIFRKHRDLYIKTFNISIKHLINNQQKDYHSTELKKLFTRKSFRIYNKIYKLFF